MDFGDKIIELLDDPDRRAHMGQFGHERVVGSLSWDHERVRLLRVYREVLLDASVAAASEANSAVELP